MKPAPKFGLVVRRTDASGQPDATATPLEVVTAFDGSASLTLAPGSYIIRSVKPLEFGEKRFEWAVAFKVEEGKDASIELSNDNAKITETQPGRDEC